MSSHLVENQKNAVSNLQYGSIQFTEEMDNKLQLIISKI